MKKGRSTERKQTKQTKQNKNKNKKGFERPCMLLRFTHTQKNPYIHLHEYYVNELFI